MIWNGLLFCGDRILVDLINDDCDIGLVLAWNGTRGVERTAKYKLVGEETICRSNTEYGK